MSVRVPGPLKGRGAISNRSGRYEAWQRDVLDDGWGTIEALGPKLRTTVEVDRARKVIAYNRSPDIAFDRSINPYRGCEHGCIYCYARPSHARFGLSPGQDFESRLFYKPDAARRLRAELSAPNYQPAPIAIGANTDAYQPVERRLGTTRSILKVLAEHRHPFTIITKSSLVERDIDILSEMAAANLANVAVSVTTLDPNLARRLEPRASAPVRRLNTIARLHAAGIPVTVMLAPIIPSLNDAELENILSAAKDAGASSVRYILLRLPAELTELFDQWLEAHYPLRRERILANIRATRGGRLYDATWHQRMRGTGAYAEMIQARFDLALRRLGFPTSRQRPATALDLSQFVADPSGPTQLALDL